MDPKIIVLGACNVDLQCFTSRLPKPGETLHGEKFMKGLGGKGANQCVAAAKLGASTGMIGWLGGDCFGQEFLESFKCQKVNIDHIKITKDMSTGMAQITVAENGENTIVIVVGANNKLSPKDVQEAKEVISAASVLVFQFETPLGSTIEALKMKDEKGIAIVNAAPALSNPDPQIFNLSDIFCVNESEAEVLTNLPVRSVEEAEIAVHELLRKGCKQVIITMGASGVVYASKNDKAVIHVPTREVKPVDTTGAGDMFIGALAFYLAYYPNLPMVKILERSCELATRSVLKPGTQSSFPTKDELPSEFFEHS